MASGLVMALGLVLCLVAAPAEASPSPPRFQNVVQWRGGTDAWLNHSAWEGGHPAYAKQVLVDVHGSVVTLDAM